MYQAIQNWAQTTTRIIKSIQAMFSFTVSPCILIHWISHTNLGTSIYNKILVYNVQLNTLWTDDADLRLYITTVQDGWGKSAFLTHAWFPRTIHLITQYMEHFSEWSCWEMFIETRVFGEYFLKLSVHKNTRS